MKLYKKNKVHENIKILLERELFKRRIIEKKNKFLRIFTDFEFYKKRIQKEKFELFKLANKEIVIEFISILDDFERCLLEINKNNNVSNTISIGIKLIYEKFFNVLKKKGLKQIKTNKGENFNTDIHEAIFQIQSSSQNLKEKIIDIVEIGYILHDKVIRHAKVIVGK